jgi:ankyrin repeat protein
MRWSLIALGGICAGWKPGTAIDVHEYFSNTEVATLAQAAATGRTGVIAQLLSAGVDLNARGKDNMTPVIWALLNQDKEGFECLLQHGANPNLQLSDGTSALAKELPFAGNSAMSLAAQHQDIWYLDTVLKYGGDVNLVNPFRGFTPIYASMEARRTLNAKRLINAGANLDYQDREGITPLIFAAMCNEYDVAYEMLKHGADPTIENKWGNTIVYFIKRSEGRTTPDASAWRDKVAALLRDKGIIGLP